MADINKTIEIQFKVNNTPLQTISGSVEDVTKKVEVPLFYGGTVKDPWGNTRAGFKATGTINRQDFKLTWSKKTDTGEAVVADDVEFTIDASLIKQ